MPCSLRCLIRGACSIQVRAFAVRRLEAASDGELERYLLQVRRMRQSYFSDTSPSLRLHSCVMDTSVILQLLYTSAAPQNCSSRTTLPSKVRIAFSQTIDIGGLFVFVGLTLFVGVWPRLKLVAALRYEPREEDGSSGPGGGDSSSGSGAKGGAGGAGKPKAASPRIPGDGVGGGSGSGGDGSGELSPLAAFLIKRASQCAAPYVFANFLYWFLKVAVRWR